MVAKIRRGSIPPTVRNSPAWHAIERGDESAALKALAAEDPHRTFRHGATLLMNAACHSMPALLEHLLNEGAGVKTRNECGQSALTKATRANTPSLDVVRLLVDHGANQFNEALGLALHWKSNEVATYCSKSLRESVTRDSCIPPLANAGPLLCNC